MMGEWEGEMMGEWEGLACPPLDDYAFTTYFTLDEVVDDKFLDFSENDPKCDDELLDFLEKNPKCDDQFVENDPKCMVSGRKITPDHRCGNNGKGKDLKTVMKVLEASGAEIKAINAFLAEEEEEEKNNDKKRKFSDHQSMQEKRRRLNQVVVGDDKWKSDYELRVEDTIQKLHERYGRCEEAKQRKKIQVIDFPKQVMEQKRSKAKSKVKAMAGICNNNKRFQPLVF